MPGGLDNRERRLLIDGVEPDGAMHDLLVPARCRVRFHWKQPFRLDKPTIVDPAWLLAHADTAGLIAFRFETRGFTVWLPRDDIYIHPAR